MLTRKILPAFLLLLTSITGRSQTFIKDIGDVYDTVWLNSPNAMTYTPRHGALISCSQSGSATASTWYEYNYMIHINDNGDSTWVKRYILDTGFVITSGYFDTGGYFVYGPHPIHFQGLVQSVTRLNNGNYLVAGNNFDTSLPAFEGYVIKQFDSMGHYLSGYLLYDSIAQYERNIKVLAADGNNFYLLYDADSIFSMVSSLGDSIVNITWVQKMDSNYHVLWSHVSYYASLLTIASGYSGDIDVPDAFTTSDNGLAYVKIYDTSMFLTGYNKYYLHRLRPDGSTNWEISLADIITPAIPSAFVNNFATHDSCIVSNVISYDTSGYSIEHLIKFGPTGSVLDSVVDSASFGGVELSNGNFLFTSATALPEFIAYDNSLHFLYAMPYPFIENTFSGWAQLIANPYGGAFTAYSGNEYIPIPSWHMVAVNFDSLFQCYPSFVTGTVYQDNNTDCIDDAGDLPIGGSAAKLHDAISSNDYYGFANDTGWYSCNVPFGNYTVTNPAYGYEVDECGAYTYSITTPATFTNNNFADTLVPNISDLQLWMMSSCLVPGDTTLLLFSAFNNGTVTADTTIVIVLAANTSFISSVPAPVSVSGDSVTYHINLLSDSGAWFNMNILVGTTVTLGDTETFTATSPFPDNVVTTDDSAVYQRVIVSSFDPNFISANQPLYFHRDNTIIYTVGFENTGTYMAKDVVIIDTLDSRLDPGTFRFLAANPIKPSITWMAGNRLYMRFLNINLPDSVANPVGSHGQISYAIKAKTTVPNGDTIHNTANIFFDYNSGVVTNTTANILGSPRVVSKVPTVTANGEIKMYPNPSTGVVNISIPWSKDIWDVTIADVAGRTISRTTNRAPGIVLAINAVPGIYFVTLTNEITKERVVRKLVVAGE